MADILLATTGADLFELKRLHDSASTYRDLVQLLYRDVDDGSLREQILRHFAEQAPFAPQRSRRKVVSDIDDTLWCNWKDTRYPKAAVYPGVLAFLEALGPKDGGLAHDHVTFLTARPRDRAGLVERLTHRRLRALGVRGATVLSGALRRIFSSRGIASGKLENLLLYRSVYPESDVVLVGDSGQGDIALGLAAREKLGSAVLGVFIHDVVDTPDAERDRLRQDGVFLFDTYAGAARQALAAGVLSKEEALHVARRALADFEGLRFDGPAAAERARALLKRDVDGLEGDLRPAQPG